MPELGPDDVPAVLQTGEEVLPREEAGLYRQLFPNGMLAALQGAGRGAMQGLDSLSGNYLRDYGDVLSGRERGWRALATLGTPMLGAGVGNAAQWIPRGGEAMLDYLAESRLVGAMPGRYQIPTARVMAAGRDAALGAAEVGEGALNGAEAYTWGQRAAPMRYDDRSGAVVDAQGRSWYHDGGTVLEPGGALRPVDYVPDFDEDSLYWHHRGELAGGGVQQPDGSISTLYQAAIPGPGGRTYNVPTVWDGQILTTGEAADRAAGQGWRFPSYATPDAADLAYEARVHPRAAADLPIYRELHDPFPTAAELRGRELMAPGRDAITPLLGGGGGLEPSSYDPSRSFRENALDPRGINNAMAIALGFAGGGLSTRPGNAMLGRIEQLTGESLEERLGGRPPGYPRRSFSEIQAGDKGELAALEPRSLFDRLPEPITTHHASPFEFPHYDFSKIGEGEGHQVYSRGLYSGEPHTVQRYYEQFQEKTATPPKLYIGDQELGTTQWLNKTDKQWNEAVAEVRRELTASTMRPGDPGAPERVAATKAMFEQHLAKMKESQLQEHLRTGSIDVHRDWMIGVYEQGLKMLNDPKLRLEPGKPGRAHWYENELHAEPDRLIRWEDKIEQQSDLVRKAFTGRGLGLEAQGPFPGAGYHGLVDRVTGKPVGVLSSSPMSLDDPLFPGSDAMSAMRQLEQAVGKERAVDMLRQAGVQGVQYLDQGSRNAAPALIKIGETKHEPSNLVGEHWLEAYPDADVGGNYEEYSGFSKAHFDFVDHNGQMTQVKNLNPKNPFDAGYLKARRLLKAKGATPDVPDPTYNYVSYSDQWLTPVKRNQQPIIGPDFRLVPIEGEPEF